MENVLNEHLDILVQIQELDTQILTILEQEKRLPHIIASLQSSVEDARKELAEATSSYEEINRKRRDLEGQLQDVEDKIRKLKGRIPEIKTNKEYQALLKEISLAEQEKSDKEEAILLLLEDMDVLKAVQKEKEKELEKEEKIFKEEKKRVEREFKDLSEKLRHLEGQKKELRRKVENKLLADYDSLFDSKRGLAVVPVQNEYCLGCHIRIPPQVYAEIRKNEKIIYCQNCQRILYWKPGKN